MRPDRTATLLCDSLLARTGLLDAAAATPVLMYHSVSSDDEPGVSPYYRLATSPQRFRDQMCLLADSGWVVTSLEQAAAPRRETARDRQVVVTFDDGFVDFLTAWPILEKLSFTASMFLPTGYIAETRRTFKGRECLTWSEVKDLSQRGVSFGSHTVTHPVLHRVPWSRVCSELRLSRAHITTAVGTPVTTFAYPYAFPAHDDAFVARFCRELRDQGYRAAVTTTIGRVGPGDDPLRLKRLPVNEGDDPALFRAKLRGAYDWLGVLQSASKRVRARRYSDEERLAYASATIGRP